MTGRTLPELRVVISGAGAAGVACANILLAADGNVLLTDFGVARLATVDLSFASPSYISPEQARSPSDLDGRSDQYALGVVLFEALTGVLPFRGADARGVIQQHLLLAPPRPAAVRPDLAAAVEEVILRALAKDRAQRFPDIAGLVAAFQKAASPPRSLASGRLTSSSGNFSPPART